MKHILPILTLALIGTAATVSADNFYYDYYQNPGQSGVETFSYGEGNYPSHYDTDSYSYVDPESNKGFTITRNSDWNTSLGSQSKSNFYRIHVVGNNVNLYLTDFVDNVGSALNDSALYNHIAEYGYRKLEQVTMEDGTKYYAATGDPTVFKLSGDDAVNPTTIDSIHFEKSYLDEDNQPVDASYTVTRYKYDLGTFKDGDVIELYMKDTEGGEAYSYSGFNELFVNNTVVGAVGGFGDGGYMVNEETDEMLNGYYYQDDNLKAAATAAGIDPERVEQIGFGYDEEGKAKRAAASAKSMPLSTLAPSGSSRYFGIIANTGDFIGGGSGTGGGNGNGNGTSGAPLPGGLQIALIAGLFGLGFWYIRRRRSSVA